MDRGPATGRFVAIFMAMAILGAPFIAILFRVEAGLMVMALALSAVSLLLSEALDAAPAQFRRWLRLGILVNVTLATACGALVAWLLVSHR